MTTPHACHHMMHRYVRCGEAGLLNWSQFVIFKNDFTRVATEINSDIIVELETLKDANCSGRITNSPQCKQINKY